MWLGKVLVLELHVLFFGNEYEYSSFPDGWHYNHTELDCSDYCLPTKFHFGDLKILTFCCKGQDFCNRYQGKGREYKVQ